MSKEGMPSVPGAWESRAFFAALLAACRNDDKTAGDILRKIAESMSSEFLESGGTTRGRTGTKG